MAGDPYILPAGAAQAGMSYVSVMKPGFWSSFHNQASLSLFRTYSCGVNYENRFGLKELSTCSVAITAPVWRASLGSIYSRFGYSDFRREIVGVACALTVSDKISAGIQIDYLSEKTYSEYNNINILTFETGVLISASEDVMIGIHLFNPVPNSLRKNEMVSVLTAGVGTNLSNNLFAGFETEITTRGNTDFRLGFEYEVVRSFIIRGGFRTLNPSFSFGIGYKAGPAIVDLSFTTHQKLGITSSVSLIFNIKNN